MYKSKKPLDKKLAQSYYIFNQIVKFKDKVFVKGGLDEKTGTYPLLSHLSSFLAQTRSVLQYAHKEAKGTGKLAEYDNCINQYPIFGFFRDLRNSDIHEYTIGSYTTINLVSRIQRSAAEPDEVGNTSVPKLDDQQETNSLGEGNSNSKITRTLAKRIQVTNELINRLEAEGKHKLAEAAKQGEDLYEEQEFNGVTDLFTLCERYLSALEDFVDCGVKLGFIS